MFRQVQPAMKTNKGFTLLELIITMALVIVVIMITGSAFNSILTNTNKLTSSEESNIEGVVGLEMFRHDLQQAGFGLPQAFLDPAPQYAEASVAPANILNDGQGITVAGKIPRAIASREGFSGSDSASETTTYNILGGTDYLAIKATSVATSQASQKWTYLNYSGNGGKAPNRWSNSADNFKSNPPDKVIVLNRAYSPTGKVTNTLVYDSTDTTHLDIFWPNNPTVIMVNAFNPTNPNQTYYLYGVANDNTPHKLSMPFNRADYFVARPSNTAKIPSTCAPNNTGILYRANINHADGKLTYMPLLDCVADMQVVFGWDINGNGVIDESGAYDSTVANIPLSSSSGSTQQNIKDIMESPEEIRNKLKYIKVYIMAQEGRKDTSYTNNAKIVVGDIESLTKGYDVSALSTKGWLNYRWKIYRIIVRPKNLASN